MSIFDEINQIIEERFKAPTEAEQQIIQQFQELIKPRMFMTQEEIVTAALFLEKLNFAEQGSTFGERLKASDSQTNTLAGCLGIDEELLAKAEVNLAGKVPQDVIAPVGGSAWNKFWAVNNRSEKENAIYNIHRRLVQALPQHNCEWREEIEPSPKEGCMTQSIGQWREDKSLVISEHTSAESSSEVDATRGLRVNGQRFTDVDEARQALISMRESIRNSPEEKLQYLQSEHSGQSMLGFLIQDFPSNLKVSERLSTDDDITMNKSRGSFNWVVNEDGDLQCNVELDASVARIGLDAFILGENGELQKVDVDDDERFEAVMRDAGDGKLEPFIKYNATIVLDVEHNDVETIVTPRVTSMSTNCYTPDIESQRIIQQENATRPEL